MRDTIIGSAILFAVITASLTAAFAIDRWLHPDPEWIGIEVAPAGSGVRPILPEPEGRAAPEHERAGGA